MKREAIYKTPNEFTGRLVQLWPEELAAYNELKKKYIMSRLVGKLLSYRLQNYSREFEKISISTLSKKMKMNQDQLIGFIKLIKRQPKSPIKYYTSDTHEVYFKKPSI